LDPDPIPAAEIDPDLFPDPEPDSDEVSALSTEKVVKQMARDAADSKRYFFRPLALAFAVLLMLFGMVYFAFGPVRDYVADSILRESEPPPLASFTSDDANKDVAPASSEAVQNQSSVIAAPKAIAEVPTAYQSADESGAVKVEAPGKADDSPGQPLQMQITEPATGVASSQPSTAPATETAPDTTAGALQAAAREASASTNIAKAAEDTSVKMTSQIDSEEKTPKTPAVDLENDQVMVGDAQRAIIFFHHDSHNLLEQAGITLKRLLETAVRSPSARISIMGYTDSLGNEWYNRKLSQTRADIVRDFLIARGIEPEKIRAVGMGADNPLASNDTADGRKKNRRVEVYIGSAVN
jgi:outer membrane protein OmpA-like peptidoglycan-associated protein